jgi:hypothetical protein
MLRFSYDIMYAYRRIFQTGVQPHLCEIRIPCILPFISSIHNVDLWAKFCNLITCSDFLTDSHGCPSSYRNLFVARGFIQSPKFVS